MANEYTLVELSMLETDPMRKWVLDTLLMESDVMQTIPWETIGQLATGITRLGTLPTVGFRKLNEGYEVSKGTLEQRIERISLMGGNFDIDKAIARAKTSIADARAVATLLHTKAMAYKFNDKFINGNPESDPEEFKGIKERVDDLYDEGYTGQVVELGGTTGAARDAGILYDTTNRHNFLDKMDALCHAIKGHQPDFLFMNHQTRLAAKSLMRREQLLDHGKDMFDRVIDIYQGARMVDIGVTADQTTEILALNEDRDGSFTSDTSCSVYAVKLGIGDLLWGIQEYPMEITDKGELEDKPIYRVQVDWPVGLAMADPYCMARLYNVWPDSTVNS